MNTTARVEPIGKLAAESLDSAGKRQGCFKRLLLRRDDEYHCRSELARYRDWVNEDLWLLFMELQRGVLKPWPLYLWGDVGVGKTRAVLCFCDTLESARYWTVRDVMDSMREGCPPWRRHWGFRDGKPALAVLDELGLSQVSDFELDAVKAFADWREDKPAIYISNHPRDHTDENVVTLRKLYDRRIASRLGAGTEYRLVGPDRRVAAK